MTDQTDLPEQNELYKHSHPDQEKAVLEGAAMAGALSQKFMERNAKRYDAEWGWARFTRYGTQLPVWVDPSKVESVWTQQPTHDSISTVIHLEGHFHAVNEEMLEVLKTLNEARRQRAYGDILPVAILQEELDPNLISRNP